MLVQILNKAIDTFTERQMRVTERKRTQTNE